MLIKRLLILAGLIIGFANQGISLAEDCSENFHSHALGGHICMNIELDWPVVIPEETPKPVTNPGGCGYGSEISACTGMEIMNAFIKLDVIDFSSTIPRTDSQVSLDGLINKFLMPKLSSAIPNTPPPSNIKSNAEDVTLSVNGIGNVTANVVDRQISKATRSANLSNKEVKIGGDAFDASALRELMVPPRSSLKDTTTKLLSK